MKTIRALLINILLSTTMGYAQIGVLDNISYLSSYSIPFTIDIKQIRLPNKPDDGKSYILCQQDSLKLAGYHGHDTLFLSLDNGTTWPYKHKIDTFMGIRMAWVFKNGNVIWADKKNNIYSSTDSLQSIDTIVAWHNNDTLEFHTPIDSDFPGNYFGAFIPESFMVNDTLEVLLWGCYWQEQDYTGPAPIHVWYCTNYDVSKIESIYLFGPNPEEKDDGTRTGGTTGNELGDTTNPIYCHHIHNTGYVRDTFYVIVGDHGAEVGLLEAVYDAAADTFGVTHIDMSGYNDHFRMSGIRSFSSGDSILWVCDDNPDYGGIYKCHTDSFTSASPNAHRAVFLSRTEPRDDMIGVSAYAEFMVSTRFTSTPAIVISNNYGETWYNVPGGREGFFDYYPYKWYGIQRPMKTDTDGYILIQNSSLAGQSPCPSLLIKIQ